ncbi:MAG: nucleotide exchange factor GrpE [Firmicutes bacterium]|nr:nucleotide exchange factor GrpE [Bacillota bacterium]
MSEEKKKEETVETPKEEKKKAVHEHEAALKAAKEETELWKNKYYMAFADVENLRKQNEKSYSEALKYRAYGFVEKLLSPLDGFHIVLSMGAPNPELKNYLTGFEYIYKQLVAALEDEGVKELSPPVGADFDTHTMQAVDTEVGDGPVNKVLRVLAKGYMLKDKARPAPEKTETEKKVSDEKPATEKKEENASAKGDA